MTAFATVTAYVRQDGAIGEFYQQTFFNVPLAAQLPRDEKIAEVIRFLRQAGYETHHIVAIDGQSC